MKRILLILVALFMALGIVFSSAAQQRYPLYSAMATQLPETEIWRTVERDAPQPESITALKHLYQTSTPISSSLVNHSGAYIARIPLANQDAQPNNWFIKINANFIDTGMAFWESEQNTIPRAIGFSQLSDNNTPWLMHTQVFELPLNQQESGQLWLYVDAKHYALPLTVDLYNSASFFHEQFVTNLTTLFAIAVMLTLALIALTLYAKTRLTVTLACAGYIGLHGLGWAAASGLVDDIFDIQTLNTTYLGMVMFPFAIASASQFTKLLFNLDYLHKRLAKLFNSVSLICLLFGLAMPLLSFSTSFIISHIIAMLWVPLAIAIGLKMLVYKDFRAKYYLLGNLLYGFSLLYYVISHSNLTSGLLHPELVVVSALAADGFCILLSLAAWLQQKKQDYSRAYKQARIDPLTHIGNRFALHESLNQLATNYIITFIDYDGIKMINDKLGHDQGDKLLRYGAKLMSSTLGNKGEVFRTGGDEFVWLLSVNSSDAIKDRLTQTEKMLALCHSDIKSKWKTAGISYGIAHSLESTNQSECLAMADQRMYQHKRSKQLAQSLAVDDVEDSRRRLT
ncbi:GGDEF domain-containing protein [Shewanella mesophila]|uniref:GGDEF domain-containing protein n=1 Tax=Shewanella mesophila TaxID=2864208 RepID=UPI001C655869|nr:diguanylate cyclase [Shewanella mesophila]QYJ86961.1 GGDEF domain-containing protein [Shewanella mesophila]